ncbi:MAG TPA: DUF485 domain-containing protein [Pyrinomonadaceae bacterium]
MSGRSLDIEPVNPDGPNGREWEDKKLPRKISMEPEPGDLTPIVGAETDVTPLGRSAGKPAHELTADEDIDVADWDHVAAMDEFKKLLSSKRRFIIPVTIFFVVYYFALPVLVGYAPGLMERKVLGVVNLAYLFALSQFFMAWIIAALYVRAASKWDEMARNILNRLGALRKGE